MANVTLKGNPVKLVGNEVKVGDTAPDFKTQKSDLERLQLELISRQDPDPAQHSVA